MKNSVRFLGFLTLLLASCFAVSAQIPRTTPTPLPDASGVSKTVEVRLPVKVQDKKKIIRPFTSAF